MVVVEGCMVGCIIIVGWGIATNAGGGWTTVTVEDGGSTVNCKIYTVFYYNANILYFLMVIIYNKHLKISLKLSFLGFYEAKISLDKKKLTKLK